MSPSPSETENANDWSCMHQSGGREAEDGEPLGDGSEEEEGAEKAAEEDEEAEEEEEEELEEQYDVEEQQAAHGLDGDAVWLCLLC